MAQIPSLAPGNFCMPRGAAEKGKKKREEKVNVDREATEWVRSRLCGKA